MRYVDFCWFLTPDSMANRNEQYLLNSCPHARHQVTHTKTPTLRDGTYCRSFLKLLGSDRVVSVDRDSMAKRLALVE